MDKVEIVKKCPVCGGVGEFQLSHLDQETKFLLRLFRCKKCHTVYHNPRMTKDAMNEYYKSGSYRSRAYREIKMENIAPRIDEHIRLIAPFLRNVGVYPKRCLDYGCSQGHLLNFIGRKYDAEIVGYDIYKDPEAVIDVVDKKEEIEGKFDLITCIHVLEHLYDPMEELTWMASKMNEHGVLMIELPFKAIVSAPHWITFSRESIPMLMNHIKAKYIYWDIQYTDIGIIMAQPNEAE